MLFVGFDMEILELAVVSRNFWKEMSLSMKIKAF